MTSTLFFLLLLAFLLWYQASGQQRKMQPAGVPGAVARYPRAARLAGGALTLLAAALFVGRWGWLTGLGAWLVGLMGVGCLVVALGPFRHLGAVSLGLLYGFFLAVELAL